MTNRLVTLHSELELRHAARAHAFGHATSNAPPRSGLLYRLSGAQSVTYARDDALAYARKFWNRPCSDGVAAIGTGKGYVKAPVGSRFVHDDDGTEHLEDADGKTIFPWKGLDDCTHFISCCIGCPPQHGEDFTKKGYAIEPAGGLDVPSTQMGFPIYGWVRVSSLVEWLLKKKIATPLDTKSKDKTKIKDLSPGDLIAYWSADRDRYQHMAIYLGSGKIACHTVCRSDAPECTWDNDWDLGGGSLTFTFLRMP